MREKITLSELKSNIFNGILLDDVSIFYSGRDPKPGTKFVFSVGFPINSAYYNSVGRSDLYKVSKDDWVTHILDTYGEKLQESLQARFPYSVSINPPSISGLHPNFRWAGNEVQFDLEAVYSKDKDVQEFHPVYDNDLLDRICSLPDNFFEVIERLCKDPGLIPKLVGDSIPLKGVRLLDFLKFLSSDPTLRKNARIHKLKQEEKYKKYFLSSFFVDKPFLFTDDLKLGYIVRQHKMVQPRLYATGITVVWLDLDEFPELVNKDQKTQESIINNIVGRYSEELYSSLDSYMTESIGVQKRMGETPLFSLYEV